jgi:ribulose-phosphate 3-epimerase
MDGVFVPNISFGVPVCKAIQKIANKSLDFHLMIQHPENYLDVFKNVGANSITVHYEACVHLHRVINEIKKIGCRAGVAINPHTPVEVLKDIIQDIDLVCMMSVNPGFGGQQFIEHTFSKIEELKKMIIERKSNALIQVDGGITSHHIEKLKVAGADVLVIGSFLFQSSDLVKEILTIKNKIS